GTDAAAHIERRRDELEDEPAVARARRGEVVEPPQLADRHPEAGDEPEVETVPLAEVERHAFERQVVGGDGGDVMVPEPGDGALGGLEPGLWRGGSDRVPLDLAEPR